MKDKDLPIENVTLFKNDLVLMFTIGVVRGGGDSKVGMLEWIGRSFSPDVVFFYWSLGSGDGRYQPSHSAQCWDGCSGAVARSLWSDCYGSREVGL